MFVCPAQNLIQFNKLEELGYKWQQGFYSGDINKTTISWRGNKQFDWTKMKSLVYKNTTDFNAFGVDKDTGEWYISDYDTVEIDLWPTVKCTEIKGFSEYFGIETKEGVEVIMIDPALQPNYRRVKQAFTGELFTIGNTRVNNFEFEDIIYKVKVSIKKKREEVSSCKNYENSDGYIDCIDLTMSNKMIDLLGCIPPWMSTLGEDKVCRDDLVFQDELEARRVKESLNQFVRELLIFGDVHFESSCKLPCQYMNFDIQKSVHQSTTDSIYWLQVNIDDKVEINEEQNNYDGFDLIVEIGSSLGLWVGLSMIGVFDISIGLIRRSFCIKTVIEKCSFFKHR